MLNEQERLCRVKCHWKNKVLKLKRVLLKKESSCNDRIKFIVRNITCHLDIDKSTSLVLLCVIECLDTAKKVTGSPLPSSLQEISF